MNIIKKIFKPKADTSDWRLQGQERYLKGVKLTFKNYQQYSPNWDHDHCSFCWATFSEYEGDLHEGYCTLDHYHWVCSECFEDFKDMFCWQVVSG